MNDNNELVTKKDLSEAFDRFEVKISQRFDQNEKLIEKLDQRTGKLEQTTERLEKRIEKNTKAIDRLTGKVIEMEMKMATKDDVEELRNSMMTGFDLIL